MRKFVLVSRALCYAVLAAILSLSAQAGLVEEGDLQLDFRGEAHYSRYNFTDLVRPYDGLDAWTELRAAYWLDNKRSLSPYVSLVPAATTESLFWWQRNVQTELGIQWYPMTAGPLRNIRLFAGTASRSYYDKPEDANAEETDLLIGGDYYYDNLYNDGLFTLDRTLAVVWTNLSYRKTNFSESNYKALIWIGNVKVGPNMRRGRSALLPYAVADWAYVPKHDERWWENYIRLGIGMRWYPTVSRSSGYPAGDFAQRYYIYAELLSNLAWLGEQPTSNSIAGTDLRIGIGFSTSGFLRQ